MKYDVVTLLATFAIASAGAPAFAQRPEPPPRIGYLSVQSASPRSPRAEAFSIGLRQLGYENGKNIIIEYRWAGSDRKRLAAFANDLVHAKVAVIVALEPPAAHAVMKLTNSIPIVIRATADPVTAGFVKSLARPGGNVTGVTSVSASLDSKRLELLRDLLSPAKDVTVLWNPRSGDRTVQFDRLRSDAGRLSLNLSFVKVTSRAGVERILRAAARQPGVGLLTMRDPLFVNNRKMIADLAARYRVTVVYDEREFAEAGGLISYGADLRDLYRQAAGYVDKILKGAKPSDLPVEQPTKYEMVVNLKTAKALGRKIPSSILLRADEVIE